MKKENHSHQTETFSMAEIESTVREHLQSLSESLGKIHGQESCLCQEYLTEISVLSKIFAMRQSEKRVHRDDFSIFSQAVVKEAERCISECLAGLLPKTQDTIDILSLLGYYGAVQALPNGKCCVSLSRLHSILQDNFQGSCLCDLFNLILGCHKLTESRVIAL